MLQEVVPGKAYYAVRFSDIGEWWILGGRCVPCARTGPVDRDRVERRWGSETYLSNIDHRLRCRACGNCHGNRFVIFGKRLR